MTAEARNNDPLILHSPVAHSNRDGSVAKIAGDSSQTFFLSHTSAILEECTAAVDDAMICWTFL